MTEGRVTEAGNGNRREDGFFYTAFTTYRGVSSIAIVVLATIVVYGWGQDVFEAPKVAERNAVHIEQMQEVQDSLMGVMASIVKELTEQRSLFFEFACTNDQFAINRAECRRIRQERDDGS